MKRAMALALLATFAAALAVPATAAAAPVTKDSTFYFVAAHPDDETVTWQLIDDFQEHYSIFVTTTHGEGTYGCLTEEESQTYHLQPGAYPNHEPRDGRPVVGPYMYEGPDSPVGEPDRGERKPLGDPWVGWGTEACAKARVAAWHRFLDDASAFDAGFPNFGISARSDGNPWADDNYKGRFCPERDGHPSPDHTVHPGADPKGKHRVPPAWDTEIGCVEVWANEQGARVAFDLGDGGTPYGPSDSPHTKADVVAAIQLLRANRGAWGIEVLPEAGMMAAAPGCDLEAGQAHNDHETIQDALYEFDFGAGPQYGGVCDGNTNRIGTQDPGSDQDRRYLESPGEQQPPDAAQWWLLNSFDPVTNKQTGPTQVNYGWLGEGSPYDFPFRTLWKRYGE